VRDDESKQAVTAYIGLGSNLGDREANISHALEMLSRDVVIVVVSSLYETEPWGYTAQPRFLNAACGIKTGQPPLSLLGILQRVERVVGRTTTFKNGPRVIDLDILLYGQRIIHSERLVVPQARLAERPFALVPLSEIAASALHPELGVTIKMLAAKAAEHDEVRLFAPPPSIAHSAH
jgi:2-amino-4-hydroxy-6-hydroxymethyldihydropteridine diphosphokinase